MTAAKLKTAPSEGHGLTDKITDVHWAAASKGEKPEDVVCVVVLRRSGIGQQETAQGMHRTVQYEAVRLEPVTDVDQIGELRYLAQALYEARTSNGQQRHLPLGIPGQGHEERRVALIERIEAWADDNDITGAELEAKWRAEFGIGDGQEYSYGDRGVPADYRKSEVAWLLQFALSVGAMADQQAVDVIESADDPEDPDEPVDDGEKPPAVMVDEIGNDVGGAEAVDGE
jgi:hypothetical protein